MPEPVPMPSSAGPRSSMFTDVPRGPIQLKSQQTAGDARAERLVKQIQGEIDQLREAMNSGQTDREPALVDIAAISADPAEAANLPPALLVRVVVAAHHRNEELERRLARAERKARELRRRMKTLSEERAWLRGRVKTFDQTMAALHANLEDFRQARNVALLGRASVAPAISQAETPALAAVQPEAR